MQNQNENISEYICQLIRNDQFQGSAPVNDDHLTQIKDELNEIKNLLKNQTVIIQSNEPMEEEKKPLVEEVASDETPVELDQEFFDQF